MLIVIVAGSNVAVDAHRAVGGEGRCRGHADGEQDAHDEGEATASTVIRRTSGRHRRGRAGPSAGRRSRPARRSRASARCASRRVAGGAARTRTSARRDRRGAWRRCRCSHRRQRNALGIVVPIDRLEDRGERPFGSSYGWTTASDLTTSSMSVTAWSDPGDLQIGASMSSSLVPGSRRTSTSRVARPGMMLNFTPPWMMFGDRVSRSIASRDARRRAGTSRPGPGPTRADRRTPRHAAALAAAGSGVVRPSSAARSDPGARG